MHIVHVEDRFEPTAGYQINELVKEQNELGYRIDIITSNKSIFSTNAELKISDREFEKKYRNCTITRISPVLTISSRYYYKGLFRIIDEKNPDIVFLHGTCDFKDLVLLQKNKKYLIYRDCHMSWVASHNKFSGIFAKLYGQSFARLINKSKKYKKIYALGKEEYDYLKNIKISDNKIAMLPHGYNSKDMYYSDSERKKLRSELGIDEDQTLVSYIGKLDKYKEPDLIFDVVKDIDPKTMENVRLFFVGNFTDDYEQKFWQKYEEFPFKSQCIFYKSQKYEDLYKYFSASDVCFWPKETTLSSIHAQICHAVPIMENQDSNKERVVDNSSLFQKNDLKDAKQKFVYVINNLDKFNFNEKIVPKLESRDYIKMVKKLDEQWRRELER